MTYVWDAAAPGSAFGTIVSLDVLLAEFHGRDGATASFDIEDRSTTALEACEAEEACAAVGAFVKSLRPRDREIVFRIYWLGQTQADVARGLGVTRMAISQAMAKVAKLGRRRLASFRTCTLLT